MHTSCTPRASSNHPTCHHHTTHSTLHKPTAVHITTPRDLKARLEALSAQLSGAASAAALEERAVAAEGRAKALAASLGRKEAALREVQAAAAMARTQVTEVQQAAAGAVAGGDAGAEARAALVQLKGELSRKEAALQVRGSAWCL